jgi:hypothetical protein
MQATRRIPSTFWMQAPAVTQTTTATSATSTIKDDRNIMTARNSRNATNSRNESNNSTATTVWPPPKAGMLEKTAKPATAWREGPTAAETIGESQGQQQKGDPKQQ